MRRIPISQPRLDRAELLNVTQAIKSGWISSKGDFITRFETGFAVFCGVRYGVATSNGTVALHLALRALGIGHGDEVIVPTLTFIATANAVSYCGARPVFVDSHPEYWGMDPAKIEEKITDRTRAIVPVHLYGHPCEMKSIMAIAQKHNLLVIEDAAEAHGAECDGQKVGSFGHVSCFSFYGNKILTTGEGGMCLTNDEALARRMRLLKDHGMDPSRKYWHDEVGYNYRMTNVQAAIGLAQLEKLDSLIAEKRRIAAWYDTGLKSLAQEGILRLPREMPWAKSVYWMYSILLDDRAGISRQGLMDFLDQPGEAGIAVETRPIFYPLHIMPPHRCTDPYPVAERISSCGLNLPSGMRLRRTDVEAICRKLRGKLQQTSRQESGE